MRRVVTASESSTASRGLRKLALKNARIISMDERVGDLECGDILVEGDVIATVGANIDQRGAPLIDMTGHIVIPGLVNAHLHTWQTALRGAAAGRESRVSGPAFHGHAAMVISPPQFVPIDQPMTRQEYTRIRVR